MALELITGAVVGAAIGELLKAVLDATNKATNFNSIFKRLQSTLELMVPRVNRLSHLNQKLNLPPDELKDFITILNQGEQLVRKCLKISSINFVKKVQYSKQLLDLDYSLLKYLQTILPLDQAGDTKEILFEIRELHRLMNESTDMEIVRRSEFSASCIESNLPIKGNEDDNISENTGLLVPVTSNFGSTFSPSASSTGLSFGGSSSSVAAPKNTPMAFASSTSASIGSISEKVDSLRKGNGEFIENTGLLVPVTSNFGSTFSPSVSSTGLSFGGSSASVGAPKNTPMALASSTSASIGSISEKVDSLRKGKGEVIEKDHILILGWSDKLGSLLKQLAIANKSIGGGVVVVLAERDKEEMDMDIAKLEFEFLGTSVICLSGSPLILVDLKKVSVSKARAIIVPASDKNADQSDAYALRVVLGLTGVKEGLRGHVVVEISDLDNEPLVKLVGGELIETVVANDVIGQLLIQCALQPGLVQIWEDILGFENAQFFIRRWPQLDGLCFEDVLVSFPNAIPFGVKIASEGGKIIINPDDNYVLKEGDEILVIAEDYDTYAPGSVPEIRRGLVPKYINPPKYPDRILICGWRPDIVNMIMVLEEFLAPGSELWMFNEAPEKQMGEKLIDGGLDVSGLTNIRLVHRKGNAAIRRHLESLPLETFDSILILAEESLDSSIVHCDSRSLATLLLIRDIQSRRLAYKNTMSNTLRHSGFSQSSWIRRMNPSEKSFIITEILDSRTRNLVSVSRISDCVLSDELISKSLAMVAEDKQINCVLEELFAEVGNEMRIRPAEFYLFNQEELLCFYEIMLMGRLRREIVIGYRLKNSERATINPSFKLEPRKWSLDDVFVVISVCE